MASTVEGKLAGKAEMVAADAVGVGEVVTAAKMAQRIVPHVKHKKTDPGKEPKRMTWMKALPIILIALIFDAIRFVFEQFWIFGPTLAGVATSYVLGNGVAGTLAGAAVGGVTGAFFDPVYIMFGFIMAMIIGFLGWATVFVLLLITNGRIFKENKSNFVWMFASLVIGEIPIVGSLPSLSGLTIKLYATEIKSDKKKMKEYRQKQQELQQEEQAEQLAELQQLNAQDAAIEEDDLAEEEDMADIEEENAAREDAAQEPQTA